MDTEILKNIHDNFNYFKPLCNSDIWRMTDKKYTLVTITKYVQYLLDNKFLKKYSNKELSKRNKYYIKTKKKLLTGVKK